uniref:Secreted protein n=1 Tax=Syphacia muris TaxID=451379 RepID=A0A0N5A8D5_9BILA
MTLLFCMNNNYNSDDDDDDDGDDDGDRNESREKRKETECVCAAKTSPTPPLRMPFLTTTAHILILTAANNATAFDVVPTTNRSHLGFGNFELKCFRTSSANALCRNLFERVSRICLVVARDNTRRSSVRQKERVAAVALYHYLSYKHVLCERKDVQRNRKPEAKMIEKLTTFDVVYLSKTSEYYPRKP